MYGEPVRRQSARISPTLWEEKKAQIIELYESLTLDQVMVKMSELGFTASRRQYTHQLEKWGISKYKVNRDKESVSQDGLESKRKHALDEAAPGDEHHASSSLEAASCKRPKTTEDSTTGPEQSVDGKKAAIDVLEQPVIAVGAEEVIRDDTPSELITRSCSSIPTSSASPAHQFWELLHCTRPDWYTDDDQAEIAAQVSRSAKSFDRSHKEVHVTLPSLTTISSHISKKSATIFAGYPLGPKGCLAPSTNAKDAFELRERSLSFSRGNLFINWDLTKSVQDWYISELRRKYDIGRGSSYREELRIDFVSNYSMLSREIGLLKSNLLDISEVIMKCLPGVVHGDSGWEALLGRLEGTESDQVSSLSARFFCSLLEVQSYRARERSRLGEAGEARGAFDTQETDDGRHMPLPDFLGTCCDLLANNTVQAHRASRQKFWRESLVSLDLVGIVDRMDYSELHSSFVRCYCGRDAGSRAKELKDLPDHGFYQLSSKRIHWLMAQKTSSHPQTYMPERAEHDPAAAAAAGGGHSPGGMSFSIASQKSSVPRRDYYLDPTMGSPCRSSLGSYGQMIAARAAMARKLKGTEEDEPMWGMDGSLPSAVPGLDKLSVSMERVSLHDRL
ncbi:hypothetical protein PG993_003843 [Apiospora rasikravindrae]|uniref:Clr5 domain-containing protein n=1 Tax=Apiospora rasikravindrae TaxID=990691 RepID=A0ABR1U3C5_9PEZI